MKTDGGWINVSECARLYGKDRKWVYDQIKRYEIETRKENNRKILRLVDLVAQRGEPEGNGTGDTASHTGQSQKVAPEVTVETELIKQENGFLRRRVEELEADRADWKAERSKLQGIIERQTLALPSPDRRGLIARVVQWVRT